MQTLYVSARYEATRSRSGAICTRNSRCMLRSAMTFPPADFCSMCSGMFLQARGCALL